MSPIFQTALIVHVISGLLVVASLYVLLLALLKRKPNMASAKFYSLWSTVFTFIAWFSAAYYYVSYYGDNVKPVIKAGQFPWAHALVMEFKEHAFLFLPILAIVILISVRGSEDLIVKDKKVRIALAGVVAVTFALSIIITASGVIISGAFRS